MIGGPPELPLDAGEVTIGPLDADAFDAAIGDLAVVLSDCVNGGASVNFTLPFTVDDAARYWRSIAPDVRLGTRIMFAARTGGRVVGTATLVPATQPNSPHRAEVAKMLVHRDARGIGLGSRLLAAVEAEALRLGRPLLLLDTEAGSDGERLYRRCGWEEWGRVPEYALDPHGAPATAVFFRKQLAGP